MSAEHLLRPFALGETDAVRLVLEMIERLGMDKREGGKAEMMERLREVIRRGVQAIREAEATVPFEQAAWKSVEARAGRRSLTLRDLRYFVRRFLKEPGIAERPLRAMKVAECRMLLNRCFAHTPQGFRKARAILHSIFEYGRQHEWCDGNPVEHIASPRVEETEIRPLTMEEVERLEAAAELPEHASMRLPLQLMLRCGLRPYEVQRLQDDDIDWRERMVRIRPSVSKTGGGRLVPLRLPHSTKPVPLPHGWQRRWRALRRAAGFSRWRPDSLRHTFASYHAAHFRNLAVLQLEMGHRDSYLLRSRYINMYHLSQEDTRHFWRECCGRREHLITHETVVI